MASSAKSTLARAITSDEIVEFIAGASTQCFCCSSRLSWVHVYSNFCACVARIQRYHNRVDPKGDVKDTLLHWMLNMVEFFTSGPLPHSRAGGVVRQGALEYGMLHRLVYLLPHCGKSHLQPGLPWDRDDCGTLFDFRIDSTLLPVALSNWTSVAGTSLDLILHALTDNTQLQEAVADDEELAAMLARRSVRCTRCDRFPFDMVTLAGALELIAAVSSNDCLLEHFRDTSAVAMIAHALGQRSSAVVELACRALIALFAGDQLDLDALSALPNLDAIASPPSVAKLATITVDEDVRQQVLQLQVIEALVAVLAVPPSEFVFFQVTRNALRKCGYFTMHLAVTSTLHYLSCAGLSGPQRATTISDINAALTGAGIGDLMTFPIGPGRSVPPGFMCSTSRRQAKDLARLITTPRVYPMLMISNVMDLRAATGQCLQQMAPEERLLVPEWRCAMRQRRAWRATEPCPALSPHMRHLQPHINTQWAVWGPQPSRPEPHTKHAACWQEVIEGQRFDWNPCVDRMRRSAELPPKAAGSTAGWATPAKRAAAEVALFDEWLKFTLRHTSTMPLSMEGTSDMIKDLSEAIKPKQPAPTAKQPTGSTKSRACNTFDLKRAFGVGPKSPRPVA